MYTYMCMLKKKLGGGGGGGEGDVVDSKGDED